MYLDRIYELKKEETFVSIYANSQELSKFFFGKIISCNEEHIIISSFSPEGEYDGLILLEIACICKTESFNKYSEKMTKLINYKKSKHDNHNFNGDLKLELMKYSLQNKYIVSIELLNSSYDDAIGFIYSINENYLTISCVDEFGNENGYVDIQSEDITRIRCNSIDEQTLKILYELE